ncbi:FUSC family protein [Mycobacterium sp. NPDC003449]
MPARLRTPDLLRPVGSSRWGMAGALAVSLGAVLVVTALSGRAELGSAVGLGFVLTAVPELPTTMRAALQVIGVRAATVLVGGGVVVLAAPHALVLGVATVAAAMFGALVPRVGATAGLAVVLLAIDLDGATRPTALWPYAVGAAVVLSAWLGWFGAARVMREVADDDSRSGDDLAKGRSEPDVGHALRVGAAVGLAVGVAALLPAEMVGGHWLVTSVLLTVQPGRAKTGMRLAQRLSGNTVGAVIAAALLGAQPPAPAVIAMTVLLFLLAMALRPVNYTWWAITGPPVLLVISEYPALFPWYEGGVRLAMNLGGALIVLLVVFAVPMLGGPNRRR